MRLINTRKHLQAFLNGAGTDQCGRTILEILSADDDFWERSHTFIQWLFPTGKRSINNITAPTAAPGIQAPYMEKALERFMDFLMAAEWQYSGNHNCKRITRVLESLQMFGYGSLAAKLRVYLHREMLFHPSLKECNKYWHVNMQGGEPYAGTVNGAVQCRAPEDEQQKN